MTKRREAIANIIDRSSLGAPAVRKLRLRTSANQRRQILRKASTRTRAGIRKPGD